MKTLGQFIGDLRGTRGLLLRQSSGWSGVGYGIIELNRARSKEANKEQLHAIAAYYNVNVDELLSAWSSDKMVDRVHVGTMAKEALKIAEKIDRFKRIIERR